MSTERRVCTDIGRKCAPSVSCLSMRGTAWDPAGSFSGDDDTRERQRRETVTKARRYLKKRSREEGSKGGAMTTALDSAEDL